MKKMSIQMELANAYQRAAKLARRFRLQRWTEKRLRPSGGRYHINVPYRHYFYFDGNYYFINVPYRHDFYVDSHYYFGYISCWVYSAFT